MNDYAEPGTFVVTAMSSRYWGIRGVGARWPILDRGSWWIGENGLPHLTKDRTSYQWETKEEAEAVLDKLLVGELSTGDWNDHE